MTTITIQLSDERLRKLTELAGERGVPPEELLREHVEEWLSEQEAEFRRATEYVLNKNKELYRRLS